MTQGLLWGFAAVHCIAGGECNLPVVLRVRGYSFFFYSREESEPPHIHVRHAGCEAKFWLAPVTLAEVRRFRAHEITEIRRLVIENERLFLEEWHGYFGREG